LNGLRGATLDCEKNDCCLPGNNKSPMDLAEFELYKKFLELKSSKEKSDDPTNEDISWCDFWKKVNVFIGKDVLPPTVMKFASYLKGIKDMSQWKESDIQKEYKTWVIDAEKVDAQPDVEKPKTEKEKAKAEKVEKAEKPKAEKAEKPKAEKAEKAEKPKAEKVEKVEKAEKPKVEKPKAEKEKPKVEKEKPKVEKEKPKAKNEKVEPEEKPKEPEVEVEGKKKIPKNVKTDVWNTFIGEGIANHKCLCCKMTTIDKAKFDCGHVLSEAEGGGQEIHNLRPICSGCNNGMGTMNMIEYVKKHGYYIGGGR